VELTLTTEDGATFVEGAPDAPALGSAEACTAVIEACFGTGADAALLHAASLAPSFFDLGTREAGDVLQRLRNHGVRLAVVVPPGWRGGSSRFGEMVAEERRGRWFALFASRADAVRWLRA
jgi:hypothetical protein